MESNIEIAPDPDVQAINEARANLMSAILLLVPVAIRAEQRQRVREKTAAKRQKQPPPANSWEATRAQQDAHPLQRDERLTG